MQFKGQYMKKCKHNLKYNSQWDSYFCDKCDIWTDDQCRDPACMFCPDRPKKPSLSRKNGEEDGE